MTRFENNFEGIIIPVLRIKCRLTRRYPQFDLDNDFATRSVKEAGATNLRDASLSQCGGWKGRARKVARDATNVAVAPHLLKVLLQRLGADHQR